MNLITLNLWGGKLYDPLVSFIEQYSNKVDIFCFQDCLFGSSADFSPIQKGRLNLFNELSQRLYNFNSYIYRDENESYFHGELLPLDVGCGQVIFVNKNIEVVDVGGFRSHEDSPYHKGGDMVSGRCQWVKVKIDNEYLTVLNLHGLWQRDSKKKDTPERIHQSKKIKEFFVNHNHQKILCGDFNIINDGNAMDILEEGMVNLIKKFKIKSTRSSHYPKEERFADYILTSPDIEVKDFRVLEDEVSDHLPLFVNIT